MQTTGMNINAFFIGVATAYYVLMAYQIFVGERKRSTRLHKLMGWISIFWALSNGKDIILTFPGMYTESMLDMIIIFDGWSALTYLAFLYELTRPGWLTKKHLLIASMPFAIYTVAYFIYPCHTMIYYVVSFLVIFGLYITIIGYRHSVSYMNYIRNYYSNIDEINISWLRKVFLLAAASLLVWLFTALTENYLADCLYYIISISIWQMVVCHCRNLKQVNPEETVEIIEEERNGEEEPKNDEERKFPFAGTLEEMIENERLYLQPSLALDDLAKRLNTNRTYLSSYFSKVISKSFYDYINELRIKQKSIPMLEEHPDYTLEQVAQESGFNSLSTFRRAFRKITGMTPGEYR